MTEKIDLGRRRLSGVISAGIVTAVTPDTIHLPLMFRNHESPFSAEEFQGRTHDLLAGGLGIDIRKESITQDIAFSELASPQQQKGFLKTWELIRDDYQEHIAGSDNVSRSPFFQDLESIEFRAIGGSNGSTYIYIDQNTGRTNIEVNIGIGASPNVAANEAAHVCLDSSPLRSDPTRHHLQLIVDEAASNVADTAAMLRRNQGDPETQFDVPFDVVEDTFYRQLRTWFCSYKPGEDAQAASVFLPYMIQSQLGLSSFGQSILRESFGARISFRAGFHLMGTPDENKMLPSMLAYFTKLHNSSYIPDETTGDFFSESLKRAIDQKYIANTTQIPRNKLYSLLYSNGWMANMTETIDGSPVTGPAMHHFTVSIREDGILDRVYQASDDDILIDPHITINSNPPIEANPSYHILKDFQISRFPELWNTYLIDNSSWLYGRVVNGSVFRCSANLTDVSSGDEQFSGSWDHEAEIYIPPSHEPVVSTVLQRLGVRQVSELPFTPKKLYVDQNGHPYDTQSDVFKLAE